MDSSRGGTLWNPLKGSPYIHKAVSILLVFQNPRAHNFWILELGGVPPPKPPCITGGLRPPDPLQKCTMIIVHACTMIIVHACTMLIVHACTKSIIHACTMIIVYIYIYVVPRQGIPNITSPFERIPHAQRDAAIATSPRQ